MRSPQNAERACERRCIKSSTCEVSKKKTMPAANNLLQNRRGRRIVWRCGLGCEVFLMVQKGFARKSRKRRGKGNNFLGLGAWGDRAFRLLA